MLKFKGITGIFLIVLATLLYINHASAIIPVWFIWIWGITYLFFLFYATTFISSEIFMDVKWRGPRNSGCVSLTFDDGPVRGKTEKILSILKEYKVPAAFFCIGKRMEKNPDLVKAMAEEGHLVGNHSYYHGFFFDFQPLKKIEEELILTSAMTQKITGFSSPYFRPPYGVTNPNVARAAQEGDFIAIGWSIRSFDTFFKKQSHVLNRITRKLRSGDIILLHDHGHVTVEILPILIERIKRKNLKIVRVDELLNAMANGKT